MTREIWRPLESFSLKQQIHASPGVGAQSTIAAGYNNIGNVLYTQGKLADARRSYQKALEIQRLTGDKAGGDGSLGNLANVMQGMGDLRGAARMQEQALRAFGGVRRQARRSFRLTPPGPLFLKTAVNWRLHSGELKKLSPSPNTQAIC